MPNRVIREGILTSERINQLTEPQEVFYRRLMSVVDDFGRYPAHGSMLRAALYPMRLDAKSEQDINAYLTACEEAGLLRVYCSKKKLYLEMTDFNQRIRMKRKRFPDPDFTPNDGQMTVTCLSNDGLNPNPNLISPISPLPETSASPSSLESLRLRLCGWFNRRPGTPWTAAELRNLKIYLDTSAEDLDALERYYGAKMAHDKDFRRRSIATLLNNFPGELDRARAFKHGSNGVKEFKL